MFYSTRSKLIIGFLAVSLLVGSVSMLIGGQLLYNSVLDEARTRVKMDLNTAREIYLDRTRSMKIALNITTLGFGFLASVKEWDVPDLVFRLERMAKHADLDFAGLTNPRGETVCRIGPGSAPNESPQPLNPMVKLALERNAVVSGTILLSREVLAAEDPRLADQARIIIDPPPGLSMGDQNEVIYGMTLATAVPIIHQEELLGILYGGVLLNRNPTIVDTVRDTVFNETYKERSIGQASIFVKDIRISTNVMTQTGKRAIGTRVSQDIKEHVFDRGERWAAKTLVLSDRYIAAYEPIEDIYGSRAGILGVGVLEEKYVDLGRKAIFIFIIITLAGMVLAVGLGYFIAHKITGPVRRLIRASQQVSEGSLTPDIGPISGDEMGVLQKTFKEMVAAMGRRRAASESKLIQSEKHASVGRLAAGVAHEINNPLTGVLTYTHMLLKRNDIADDIRADLETIADATNRVRSIVKGLLDFSRQTELNPEETDINQLVRAAVSLMENQALVKEISIKVNEGENLPKLILDRSQFQSVLINILLNALDATESGGMITISTMISFFSNDPDQEGVEISVADTGCGIPKQNLGKLFDPFFTTKEVGKGTGLGLSVSLGIVQRHGGTIKAQSELGKGSTFSVWVPVKGQEEQDENTSSRR